MSPSRHSRDTKSDQTYKAAVELAARLTARTEPIELPLTHDEFKAYVLSLRNYMQRASAGNMTDWNRRMQAIDLLREVRDTLCTDSIDTAQLTACNESRASVLDDQSPYPLRLSGELGGLAVLALEEYRWVGVLRWQPFVRSLMGRITEAAR